MTASGGAAAAWAASGTLPTPASAQTRPGQPTYHYLPATADTVHWGYFSKLLKLQLEVDSGDYVTIEALTHHANDDAERMLKGDPGAESVFLWTKEKKGVNRRGAGPIDGKLLGRGAGEGFGVHICTGPVYIRGAEPGDILEVRVMDEKPRLKQVQGDLAQRDARIAELQQTSARLDERLTLINEALAPRTDEQ